MGVAATQMERKGIVTERGNQNREIAHTNGIIFEILAKLKQLKDWLKGTLVSTAITPAAEPTKTEKPSVLAQIERYKTAIAKTQKPEPSALDDLHERFNAAREKLRQVDAQLKSARNGAEYDKILPERYKVYAEFIALKKEVQKAEKNLPGRGSRVRDLER